MTLKAKSIVALVVYVIGSLGITINYHYCGGHLVDMAFYHYDESNCCGEDEKEDHNCCSNEYVMLDTDDSEDLVSVKCANKCNGPASFIHYPMISVLHENRFFTNEQFIPHDHGPPLLTHTPTFILHCVLII